MSPARVVQKQVKTRLDHWMESNMKSTTSQFGFKTGFGTLDCFAILATDVADTFVSKDDSIAVFMDHLCCL